MVVEDLYALLAASSDACLKFRAAQESNKGIILRNWNAVSATSILGTGCKVTELTKDLLNQLVYQFRVGILLLYCFWATPASLRTPAYCSVETAVNDCSETLLSFAKRWPTAAVFHDTFTCIAAQTPFNAMGETIEAWKFPSEEVPMMESHIAKLRQLRTHKSVLSIIEAIVRWPPIFHTEDTDSFIAAIGLDPMNLFELGQATYGGELLYFDM